MRMFFLSFRVSARNPEKCGISHAVRNDGRKITYRQTRGFTLVEILVTISVIVMLMSVTTISFLGSEKNELVRLSARRIGDALQRVETYAQSSSGEYPSAKSYGVHIVTTLPQGILTFADINTTGADGKPFIGRWDGVTVDAKGLKDIQIGDIMSIDAARRGDIILDTITIAYILNDGVAVNATCMKGADGTCVMDSNNNFLSRVTSIDIAARPPAVRFSISGGADFPSNPAGITVKQVIFDVKRKNSDRHKLVTLNPLSGRIDVEY